MGPAELQPTKVTPPEQLALPATRSPCNSLSPGDALCLQIFNSSRPSSSRPSPSRAPTYKSDSTRTTRSPCNSLFLQLALSADPQLQQTIFQQTIFQQSSNLQKLLHQTNPLSLLSPH